MIRRNFAEIACGAADKRRRPMLLFVVFEHDNAAEPRTTCAHCGEPLAWREMTAEFEPGAW